MEVNMLELLSEGGYIGMCVLLLLESIFPPIPSEAILTLGGFLTECTNLTMRGMLLASTVGSVAGAIVLYGMGRLLSIERIDSMLSNRWIKKAGFQEGDVKKAFLWFEKHQKKAVLFGRCIPVVRSLISIPAGINRMSIPRFLIYTTIGSALWNTILLNLGKKAGTSWPEITALIQQYSNILLTTVTTAIILTVLYKINKINKKD